tara:strand:+ start:740 stop:1003 length:264 start_codon:yes stop_codon:yes gene_type:complete
MKSSSISSAEVHRPARVHPRVDTVDTRWSGSMRTRVEEWGGEAWGGSSAALADHKESVTIAVAASSGLSVLGMFFRSEWKFVSCSFF